MIHAVEYKHRTNPDGSYDSICMQCYRTVGTTKNEDELREKESAHICAGWADFADNVHPPRPFLVKINQKKEPGLVFGNRVP